jgi:uncharacterized protein YjbI with pentapeptide repeats
LAGCRFQNIHFEDCKIVGAEFYKCEKVFFAINAKNCLLQYCNFSNLKMKQTSFQGCKLKECYFTDTILSDANFKDAQLEGSIFHNSDLTKADFRGATHYSIDVRVNKVKKAKFSFPEAMALLQSFEIDIA